MSDIAAGTEPRVSVVIVNWRAPDDTLAAIECLRLQTCQPHRTYIVDNGSADGSLQKLETAGAGFVDTAVLANSENLGFGGGCNRGLKEALTDGCAFIWLLNNDAIPAPDCLGALVSTAMDNPNAGMVGSWVTNPDQPTHDHAGSWMHPWLLVLRYLFGAKLGQDVALVGFFTGTLNYRIQADLLPALILLFMEIAWLAGQRGRYLFGMALLAGFYLVLSAITTSKAGMVFFLMQVIILMYLTGQSIWKYPVRLTLAAVGGVLTFIGASQLRAQALGIGDSAIWVSLKDGYIVETLFQVVGLIANRIPGVEGVALTCGLSCDTLLAFQMPTFDRGPIDIYTYDIVGVLGTADFRSPGLIAGAIILAGLYGGAAIVLAALMVGKSACNQMDRYKFSAATRAAFLFGMLRFMMEGAWNWVDIASMLAGVMAVEAIARAWRVKPVQQIAPVIKSGTYNFV